MIATPDSGKLVFALACSASALPAPQPREARGARAAVPVVRMTSMQVSMYALPQALGPMTQRIAMHQPVSLTCCRVDLLCAEVSCASAVHAVPVFSRWCRPMDLLRGRDRFRVR